MASSSFSTIMLKHKEEDANNEHMHNWLVFFLNRDSLYLRHSSDEKYVVYVTFDILDSLCLSFSNRLCYIPKYNIINLIGLLLLTSLKIG